MNFHLATGEVKPKTEPAETKPPFHPALGYLNKETN
jgi:hypothetical protein